MCFCTFAGLYMSMCCAGPCCATLTDWEHVYMAIVLYCKVAEENHVFGKQCCNVGGISVCTHTCRHIHTKRFCSISIAFDQTGGVILSCIVRCYAYLSLLKATEESVSCTTLLTTNFVTERSSQHSLDTCEAADLLLIKTREKNT